MAKDPAFLFYPGDWLGGTMGMSFEVKGCYMELLIYQFNNGSFTEAEAKQVLSICFDIAWPMLRKKFTFENNEYYNKRLREEIEKRKAFTESRRRNGLIPKKNYKAYAEHMEDENENEDLIKKETKKFENEFEVFRKIYPGTKKGLSTEFVNFKKKHKDWKTIIPILTDRLKQQISAKEQNRVNGAFVPEWKNLQTYINQRDWEAEIPIAEPKLNGSPRETYTPKIPTIE